ncbi:parallel beta-helix repeat (two copies) [Opitutaceae bacterium TAV1]|nr:parallel beta-helix repeat (two copies) [Opitutaceae bacterium TAV1]
MTCSDTRTHRHRARLVLFRLILPVLALCAAPLGARTLLVDQNHPQAGDPAPDAADAGDFGTESRPFRTISAATALAGPGDTVYVQPGVYREHVAPVRGGTRKAPVIWQAAPGHRVFVKGSEVWKPVWTPVEGASSNVFEAPLDPELFKPNEDLTNPDVPVLTNPYLNAIAIGRNLPAMPARPVSAWTDTTREWLADKGPGRRPRTLGQVFVDGVPLTEVETRDTVLGTPGTWIVNDDGDGLLVHFSPSSLKFEDRLVELTVRDRVFAPARRGLEYIIVRGFVFEHAANQGPFPQGGLVSLRGGRHWLVEDNIIRHAKTIGIDVGSETWDGKILPRTVEEDRRLMIAFDNTFRGNQVTDNGLSGMAGWNCPRIVIENNRVERNNALGFRPLRVDHWVVWEEHAGIKLHVATNARIEGNLVQDNDAHGIWIDNVFTNARITRNVVLNNAGGGIMMELGNGPGLIDHNIVAFTRAYSNFYAGDGIYGHDSSNITVAHNLSFSNARYGVFFQRLTDRKSVSRGGTRGDPVREPVQASGLRVLNNLLLENGCAAINFPGAGDRTKDNLSDYNVISSGDARFVLNDGKGSAMTGPTAVAARKVLTADTTGVASRKEYAQWNLTDGLTLPEWRLVTGNDTHSAVGKDRLILRPLTREIEIKLDAEGGLVRVPAVELADKFAGQPMPTGPKVLPGPWQNLDQNNRRFVIWPLPSGN